MAIQHNSSNNSLEDPFQKWLQFLRKNWIYFLGTIFILASIFYRFSNTGLKNKQDLLASKAIYAKWVGSFDKKNFQRLEKLLCKNPSLNFSFAPLIANKFLEKNDYKNAEAYAHTFLGRIKKIDSAYHLFSEASLLIAKQEYEQALSKSLQLKQVLENTKNFLERYNNLYVNNSIRVMFLQNALNHPKKEQEAIEHLESFLKRQDFSFSRKEALTLYLSNRKEQLKAPF